jgi:hypothetical protein
MVELSGEYVLACVRPGFSQQKQWGRKGREEKMGMVAHAYHPKL